MLGFSREETDLPFQIGVHGRYPRRLCRERQLLFDSKYCIRRTYRILLE